MAIRMRALILAASAVVAAGAMVGGCGSGDLQACRADNELLHAQVQALQEADRTKNEIIARLNTQIDELKGRVAELEAELLEMQRQADLFKQHEQEAIEFFMELIGEVEKREVRIQELEGEIERLRGQPDGEEAIDGQRVIEGVEELRRLQREAGRD